MWRWQYFRSVKKRRNISVHTKHKVLSELLAMVCKGAEGLKIKPVLLYGTLLGWFRNGDILCHDFDVDIGITGSMYFYRLLVRLQRILDSKQYTLPSFFWGTWLRFFVIEDSHTSLNIDVFV